MQCSCCLALPMDPTTLVVYCDASKNKVWRGADAARQSDSLFVKTVEEELSKIIPPMYLEFGCEASRILKPKLEWLRSIRKGHFLRQRDDGEFTSLYRIWIPSGGGCKEIDLEMKLILLDILYIGCG
ncbi:hypothetical protein Tco_0167217 [Tanacetum coccineum]